MTSWCQRESEHYFLDLAQIHRPDSGIPRKPRSITGGRTSARFSQNFVKDGLRGRPDHPRYRLGHSRAAGWLGRQTPLRLVRCGHGIFHRQHRMGEENVGEAGRMEASGGTTRKPKSITSSARTISLSTPSSGRRSCFGINGIYNEDDPTYGDTPAAAAL